MTTETETFRIALIFVIGDNPTERRFATSVTIGTGQPFTDASDIARERLAAAHGENAEVVDEG